MPTSALIALNEYMTTAYEPDAEWIEGELKERPMGTNSHGSLQTFFIKFFGRHEQHWQVRVVCEVRTQVAQRRYRIPDIMLLRADDPFEEIVTIPPRLCIEILSPDDRAADLLEKIEDYLAMGVPAIWVIDPRLRKAFEVQQGGLIPVPTLTVPESSIQIASAEIFAELDRLQSRK